MNKKELVGAIVDKTGFTKKDSEALELLREKQESAEIQESQNSLYNIGCDLYYIRYFFVVNYDKI